MAVAAQESKDRNRRWRRLLVGLAVLTLGVAFGGDAARGAPVTLQNDGFTSGGSAGFIAGFVVGEMGAATLGPVNEDYQINEIQLLFGPEQTPNDLVTITLRIYMDTGAADPGTELFNGDFQLAGASDALHSIDVSAENLVMSAGDSFRVAVEFQHDGAPAIARDDDGINAGRNWIMADGIGWVSADTLGVTGDWVIRAVVETQGVPAPDGGVLDGGVLDSAVQNDVAVSPDAATNTCTDDNDCGPGETCNGTVCVAEPSPSSDDSGCGCRAGGAGSSAPLLLLLLVGLVALLRRKR